MTELVLQFDETEDGPPQLTLTHYSPSGRGTQYRSVRGQSTKARGACGTFALSSGVLGMIAAILKAKVANNDSLDENADWLSLAGVSSKETRLAVAFDSALSKEPHWLSEMFGTDASGRAMAKRLFIRENPERKRPGPVIVALNRLALPPENIAIRLGNGRQIDATEAQSLLSSIYAPENQPTNAPPRNTPSAVVLKRANVFSRGLTAETGIIDADSAMQSLANVESSLLGQHVARVESLLLHTLCGRVVETLAPKGVLPSGSITTTLEGVPIVVVAQPAPGNPTTLRLSLENGVSSEQQLTVPCYPEARFLNIEIWSPSSLSRYVEHLAQSTVSYWTAAYRHLRGLLHVTVRRLNPAIVDELYRLLRQQISLSSGDDTLLNSFSLFLHTKGHCRYILDDLRHKSVRSALHSSRPIWRRGDDGFSRMAQTEAWYSMSVNASANTMSFAEAIVPRRCWSGTPDTWTTPIPGFGASEVAVYGAGVSWAVPIDLGTSSGGSTIACCAVFPDTVAHALRAPLTNPHSLIQPRLEALTQQLEELPLSIK